MLWEIATVLPPFGSTPGQLSCALYHVVAGSGLYSILRRKAVGIVSAMLEFAGLKETQVDKKLDMHPQGTCFWLTNEIACLCICPHSGLLPVWFWHAPC